MAFMDEVMSGGNSGASSFMDEVMQQPSPSKAKSVGGFIKNAASDTYNTTKNLITFPFTTDPVEAVIGLGKLGVGASEAIQRKLGMIDYPQSQSLVPGAEATATQIGSAVKNAVTHPLDYAYEKPFTSALTLTGGLKALSQGAEAANLGRTAATLSKMSEYTNPTALVSKPLEMVANTNLPERLYGSATKMPLSKKWTDVLPGKELSMRQSAVKAGLENSIPPSEYGIAKVTQLEQQTRKIVDDLIDIGAAKGDSVNTEDIIKNGLSKAYERAAKSSDPVGAKQIVDELADKFRAHGDVIPTDKLQQVKRQLYDEVKWGGSEQTALVGQLKTMGKKGLAHEAMTSLEKYYPQIKGLNQTDAAYINLKEALERAVGREMNKDIVGLGAKVLSVKNIPMAIFEATIGHPQVKARLAFALNKLRQSPVVVPISYNMPKTYTLSPQINDIMPPSETGLNVPAYLRQTSALPPGQGFTLPTSLPYPPVRSTAMLMPGDVSKLNELDRLIAEKNATPKSKLPNAPTLIDIAPQQPQIRPNMAAGDIILPALLKQYKEQLPSWVEDRLRQLRMMPEAAWTAQDRVIIKSLMNGTYFNRNIK